MVSAAVRWYQNLPKIQDLDLYDRWFQHNGATCHIEGVTMVLLRGEFGEHLLTFGTDQFAGYIAFRVFLWGYNKVHVYTDYPSSIDALEEALIREISDKMC